MFKKLIYTAFLGLAMTSCSEDLMDRINTNEANPPAAIVDAKFQVTSAMVNYGFSTYCGQYAWWASSFTEQTFGTGNNQAKNCELRNRQETAGSTTYNNEWSSAYTELENIRQIIAKTDEGGKNAGQNDIRGIGQTMWVLTYGTLTELHGDIPYSEALQGAANLQPKLDSQESIYTDLFTRIDDAINCFNTAIANGEKNVGNQDILFGGDCHKWLAFAYAVKTRMLINKSFRDPAALAQAITTGQKALDEGFNGAEFTFFNGVDRDNPWTAYNWSRAYTGANNTTLDILNERNDPRADIYAVDYFGSGIISAPAGDADLAGMTETVGLPIWLDNGAAPLAIMTLNELYFEIAEAKARQGQDATAEFQAGIEASMAQYSRVSGVDIDPAAISDYIQTIGTPTLKEIMVQKYISQAVYEQIQTYNDMRRCMAQGEEFIHLNNPNNFANGQNQWPYRFPYGNDDVISNPNVAEAFGTGNDAGNYLFTEHTWLNGGTR